MIVSITKTVLEMIQPGLEQALTGCSVVVPGSSAPGTAVQRFATGATLTSGSSLLVSGLSCPGQWS